MSTKNNVNINSKPPGTFNSKGNSLNTNNSNSKRNVTIGQIKKSLGEKPKSKIPLAKSLFNRNLKSFSSRTGIQDLNFGQILDTALTVGKTAVDTLTNPVQGLTEIPNTVLKVIDTSVNSVTALNKSDLPTKNIQMVKSDLNQIQNQRIVDELGKTQPIITTTQLPSSYSTELQIPPPRTYENVDSDGNTVSTAVGGWQPQLVQSSASTLQQCVGVLKMLVTDSSTFAPNITNAALNKSKWRLNYIDIMFLPSNGQSYPGNFYITATRGTIQVLTPTLQQLSQRKYFVKGSLNKPLQMRVIGEDKWFQVYNPAGGEDWKFYTDYMWACYCQDVSWTTGANQLGSIFTFASVSFKFEVELQNIGKSLIDYTIREVFNGWALTNDIKFLPYIKCIQRLFQTVTSRNSSTKLLSYQCDKNSFSHDFNNLSKMKINPKMKEIDRDRIESNTIIRSNWNNNLLIPDQEIDEIIDRIFFNENLRNLIGDIKKQFIIIRTALLGIYGDMIFLATGQEPGVQIDSVLAAILSSYIRYKQIVSDPSDLMDEDIIDVVDD